MSKNWVLTRDITIKAGTVFGVAPAKVERFGEHRECMIGMGDDACGLLTVDDAALESGYFLEVSDKPFVASPAQCEDYGVGEWTDNGYPIADLLAD
jgi:hypothetical protein